MSAPLRLAYAVTRGDIVGGAQVHVRDLSRAMRAAGHDAAVMTGSEGLLTEQLADSGVPFFVVPGLVRPIQPRNDVRAVAGLVAALRSWAPDILSMHSSKTRLVGALATRIVPTRTLASIHGWAFSPAVRDAKSATYAAVEGLSARIVDRVITVSHFGRGLALRYHVVPRAKLGTIHNGMPDLAQAPPVPTSGSGCRILMVARHEKPKDHATILDALAQLRDLEWRLDVVGGGRLLDDNRARADTLGLSDRVHMMGESDQVPHMMGQSDVFALITRAEGLPRSIIEAMRSRLPVVASDVGGVNELVVNGVTGALCRRSDPADVARALRPVIESSELRRRLGDAGRERYEAHFTFERMFDETLAVYRELMGN